MKTACLFRGLFYLGLTVGFLSCEDHRIPAVSPGSVTDRMRVKTVTQEVADMGGRKINSAQKISSFNYDAQGRLSMINTFQSPDSTVAPVENTVFEYDAQNRLTHARREIVRRSGSIPNPYELYTYSYNAAGQMTQLNYTSGDANNWEIKLQYDAGNHLKSSYKVFSISGIFYSESNEYTFTGKNVTSVIRTTMLTRTLTTTNTGTINFTYDTNINPFYGIFVIPAPFIGQLSNPQGGNLSYYTYYGGIDNLLNLSQNNLLNDGSSTYAYTYNGSHLPTTRTTTYQGRVTETLHYEYENY